MSEAPLSRPPDPLQPSAPPPARRGGGGGTGLRPATAPRQPMRKPSPARGPQIPGPRVCHAHAGACCCPPAHPTAPTLRLSIRASCGLVSNSLSYSFRASCTRPPLSPSIPCVRGTGGGLPACARAGWRGPSPRQARLPRAGRGSPRQAQAMPQALLRPPGVPVPSPRQHPEPALLPPMPC